MTSSALPLNRAKENTIRLMTQMARKLCSTRLAMYRCIAPSLGPGPFYVGCRVPETVPQACTPRKQAFPGRLAGWCARWEANECGRLRRPPGLMHASRYDARDERMRTIVDRKSVV